MHALLIPLTSHLLAAQAAAPVHALFSITCTLYKLTWWPHFSQTALFGHRSFIEHLSFQCCRSRLGVFGLVRTWRIIFLFLSLQHHLHLNLRHVGVPCAVAPAATRGRIVFCDILGDFFILLASVWSFNGKFSGWFFKHHFSILWSTVFSGTPDFNWALFPLPLCVFLGALTNCPKLKALVSDTLSVSLKQLSYFHANLSFFCHSQTGIPVFRFQSFILQ